MRVPGPPSVISSPAPVISFDRSPERLVDSGMVLLPPATQLGPDLVVPFNQGVQDELAGLSAFFGRSSSRVLGGLHGREGVEFTTSIVDRHPEGRRFLEVADHFEAAAIGLRRVWLVQFHDPSGQTFEAAAKCVLVLR